MEDKTNGTADLRRRLALWRTGRTCGKHFCRGSLNRQEPAEGEGLAGGHAGFCFDWVKRPRRWKTTVIWGRFWGRWKGGFESGNSTELGLVSHCSTWNICCGPARRTVPRGTICAHQCCSGFSSTRPSPTLCAQAGLPLAKHKKPSFAPR